LAVVDETPTCLEKVSKGCPRVTERVLTQPRGAKKKEGGGRRNGTKGRWTVQKETNSHKKGRPPSRPKCTKKGKKKKKT